MAPARGPLTREAVVEAALRIVEQDGIERLSMRKLGAELGVASTAVYWHVGNREALLDALVERELSDLGAIRASGRTPEDRLLSVAKGLRRQLLARPHVIGLVHERGLTPLMFAPAQAALSRELRAGGLDDDDAAFGVRALQSHVIGSAVLERWEQRSPDPHPTAERRWRDEMAGAGVDPAQIDLLARSTSQRDLFDESTRALVRALLARSADPAASRPENRSTKRSKSRTKSPSKERSRP